MADNLDSSDHEDVFASPSERTAGRTSQQKPDRTKTPTQPSRYDAEEAQEAREAALRRELEGVRNINQVIEGVIGTLERARGNMGTVSKTVENASTLLNTWTRILSQTEHNQRLILNPNWKGATQDLADAESEVLEKQREAERRAAEMERRREEARRKAEEEERQKLVAPTTRGTSTRGTRAGRGRGIVRGASSGYGLDSSSSSSSTRGTSGIGRGFGSVRGRARGSKP
ncbi:DASH complex subunit Duo1-domain-containing protein [Echria macrotheca]|uniref:DASH complex subunit DUO1 n=1 Tax=Echria macrotheca TaxID=438768 RepID=A0AAJ0BPK2_9PEZI|nr:DASH complex subunit Duo1-domain-containing protein [Echria macrotheca]